MVSVVMIQDVQVPSVSQRQWNVTRTFAIATIIQQDLVVLLPHNLAFVLGFPLETFLTNKTAIKNF